jgi:hypothetical protein
MLQSLPPLPARIVCVAFIWAGVAVLADQAANDRRTWTAAALVAAAAWFGAFAAWRTPNTNDAHDT